MNTWAATPIRSEPGRAEVVLAQDGRFLLHFGAPGTFSGDMEHWNDDVFRLYFDGGDGQTYRSSFATFTVEPEPGVAVMDLGFMDITGGVEGSTTLRLPSDCPTK